MPIDPDRAVLLASGAAMVCLAGLILALDARRLANRAFSALLAARGFTNLLPQLSTDAAWRATAVSMQPYFLLALVPLIVLCAFVYPRASPALERKAGWTTLAAIAVLELAYWADHGLYQTLSSGEAANGALRAGPGLQFVGFGPLVLVGALVFPAMALLALRFGLQYRRDARAPEAPLLLLVSGGCLMGALFDGASRVVALADLLDQSQGFLWSPWGWAVVVLPPLALIPALLTVVVIGSGRRRDPRPLHHVESRLVLLAMAVFVAGLSRLFVPPSADPAGGSLVLLLLGFSRLLMPLLVTIALVYHTGQGVHMKLQEGIAWASALAMLALVAILGAAASARVLEAPGPLLVAVVVAGLLAVGARTLLRAGRAVARWLLPPRDPWPDAAGGRAFKAIGKRP